MLRLERPTLKAKTKVEIRGMANQSNYVKSENSHLVSCTVTLVINISISLKIHCC